MVRRIGIGRIALSCGALLAGGATPPPGAPGKVVASIALSQPFGARPGWQFIATQGPEVVDPLGDPGERAPGVVRLCLSPDGGRTCRSRLDALLARPGQPDLFAEPHGLEAAGIVRPRPDRPLLLIRAASLHSGNGDQRVATVALAYDRGRDTFVPAYEKRTGRNNNQEIRYIAAGPLRGALVSAEPTADAPFGFWITVERIGAKGPYRQVLRYRSATRYGDDNPLAVIDSEMPETLRRLRLWRPGSPLPRPARACPAPHLVGRVLWCVPHAAAAPATG